MRHDSEGNVLDVGRKSRTIPAAIRRALDARDPTCVWPGCDCRFVQGHHIEFWADGGETKLDNLCNLCTYHHHRVHDGGFRVERLPDGEMKFSHERGWMIPSVPSAAPVDALVDEIPLKGWEGKPKWGYEPIDLGWIIGNSWRPPPGWKIPMDSYSEQVNVFGGFAPQRMFSARLVVGSCAQALLRAALKASSRSMPLAVRQTSSPLNSMQTSQDTFEVAMEETTT